MYALKDLGTRQYDCQSHLGYRITANRREAVIDAVTYGGQRGFPFPPEWALLMICSEF